MPFLLVPVSNLRINRRQRSGLGTTPTSERNLFKVKQTPARSLEKFHWSFRQLQEYRKGPDRHLFPLAVLRKEYNRKALS